MFEWLDQELSEIKTRKFHLIGRPPPEIQRKQELQWPCAPPPSYREFIERFGCVFLYRKLSSYLIRVFPKPVLETNKKGQEYLQFGGFDSGIACFRKELLKDNEESPVFERRGFSGLFQTAKTFAEWIESRRRAARKRYKSKEWKEILRGPPPFTAEELEIVRARSLFRWRKVGVASNGNLLFEVSNGSSVVLPYLTIGIRGPNLVGAIRLPVGNLLPGSSQIIEFDAYKKLVDPGLVEPFEKPEPWPEDRDRYGEFQK